MVYYNKPGWLMTHFMNRAVGFATKLGVSVWGSHILRVRGRKSSEWRSVPVNLLTLGNDRYLVAPRGETEWVRNIRVAQTGELVLGRRVEPITATELTDSDKPDVLRAYLRRWRMEVGVFFDGVHADSPEQELLRIAPRHPVFRVSALTS